MPPRPQEAPAEPAAPSSRAGGWLLQTPQLPEPSILVAGMGVWFPACVPRDLAHIRAGGQGGPWANAAEGLCSLQTHEMSPWGRQAHGFRVRFQDGRMNIQEEHSREASEGVNADEEGEDSSEEGTEDSSGPDGHSDLECNAESEEEESQRPEQEQRQTPSDRVTGGGQTAREAARAELPYTFEGDKLAGFPRLRTVSDLAMSRPRWGCTGSGGRGCSSGHVGTGRLRLQLLVGTVFLLRASWCCPGAWCRLWHSGGGLCPVTTDRMRADTRLFCTVVSVLHGDPGPRLGAQ